MVRALAARRRRRALPHAQPIWQRWWPKRFRTGELQEYIRQRRSSRLYASPSTEKQEALLAALPQAVEIMEPGAVPRGHQLSFRRRPGGEAFSARPRRRVARYAAPTPTPCPTPAATCAT